MTVQLATTAASLDVSDAGIWPEDLLGLPEAEETITLTLTGPQTDDQQDAIAAIQASAQTLEDDAANFASQANASMVTVTGLLQWRDTAGNLHPIRNARIELREADPFPFSDDYVTEGGTDNVVPRTRAWMQSP